LVILHNTLRIATFNIHKGFSHFSGRFSLHLQREMLQTLHADIIFLQEVQDTHLIHSKKHASWPANGQVDFLANLEWADSAYGKNAVYPAGHHGNVVLSKFPILHQKNYNISAHQIEQRGMLHCVITPKNWSEPLHVICLHLGLLARWRHQQLSDVANHIAQCVPSTAPLIVAGDFNDWSTRAGQQFAQKLDLIEVFEAYAGSHARSFPAWFPMFKLDRIYTRGFAIKQAEVHAGRAFAKLSDHAILSSTLTKL
jgi:endonuclease/exonuclease/phosphatase family metal-dependent hydrolase